MAVLHVSRKLVRRCPEQSSGACRQWSLPSFLFWMDETFREFACTMQVLQATTTTPKRNTIPEFVSTSPQRNTEKQEYSSQATQSRSVSETTFGSIRINGELFRLFLHKTQPSAVHGVERSNHMSRLQPTNHDRPASTLITRTHAFAYWFSMLGVHGLLDVQGPRSGQRRDLRLHSCGLPPPAGN